MLPKIEGSIAWIFTEENYDIDLIVGIENMKEKNIDVLKSVCMKSYDENFEEHVVEGDVIVGNKNFGYGHPHYPSFKALRALGVTAVFAHSFAPGFYRGETTNGFPLIECPELMNVKPERFDRISYCWEKNLLTLCKQGEEPIILECSPVPKKVKDLIECGGIMNYLKQNRI